MVILTVLFGFWLSLLTVDRICAVPDWLSRRLIVADGAGLLTTVADKN